jgi:uncharacterized membrane protein
MLWLAFIAKSFYQDQIGFLIRKNAAGMAPIWESALMVYVAITLGIILFALPKAENSMSLALVYGSLLGLVIYLVYECTNYALIDHWPLKITLVDTLWGVFLCGVSTCFCLAVKRWLS